MIKVLHIYNNLDVAGAQTVIMNYLRYLNGDNDINMTLLVNGIPNGSSYEKECEEHNYPVIYSGFQAWHGPWGIRAIYNWLKCQYYLYREIRHNKPDIVHTHGTDQLPYLTLPILLARVKSHIHTLHSDPYTFRKYVVIWARFAFNWLHIYPICVTQDQAQKAIQRYHIKDYIIIRNGIDAHRFAHNYRASIRHNLGITDNTIVIGSVGRFEKIKNHEFLVRIFTEYVKCKDDAILMLVGEGSERGNILHLATKLGIANKILFTGQRKDVERMYYAMDLFMLTSFFESSSIVTVEAQMAGIKCVIADSIPEDVVLTNNVNRISLKSPIIIWLAAMNDELPHDTPKGNLDDYTIEATIRSLKQLYKSLK